MLQTIDEKKATKFQRRLRVEIRYQLVGAQLTDYAIVVQRAYIFEKERNELRAAHVASRGASSSHYRAVTKRGRGRQVQQVRHLIPPPVRLVVENIEVSVRHVTPAGRLGTYRRIAHKVQARQATKR